MSKSCQECGEAFDTLSALRLHECPSGAQYGGEAPDEDIPVADLDPDSQAELAVSRALVCDVCGEKSDGADDLDKATSQRGVSFTVRFRCDECGANNENTATLE